MPCIILGLFSQISTGASDDIRRCSSLAYQTVSEYGLSRVIGPLSVNTLSSGGSDEPALIGRDSGLCTVLYISSSQYPRYHQRVWHGRALVSRLAIRDMEDIREVILAENRSKLCLNFSTKDESSLMGTFGGSCRPKAADQGASYGIGVSCIGSSNEQCYGRLALVLHI